MKTDELKHFKHLDTITVLFVVILLVSNIVASKIIQIGSFPLSGAVILFPLSYIFGDILTEVYGYKRARKVIWLGFGANIIMAFFFWLVGTLPNAPFWQNQQAYNTILGVTPKIVLASLIGYFAGEFTNSFVLAKLKLKTKGKWLWSRTISSTVVGEFVDTVLFILIAFWGAVPQQVIMTLIVTQYIAKTAIEIIFTPITYAIVNWLKKSENEDYFDKKTNFNPFSLAAK